MTEYRGVLICSEALQGSLAAISWELLGIGRKLANDLGEELYAFLPGRGVQPLAQELVAGGADKVFVADDPRIEYYQTDSYTALMDGLCRQLSPQIVLMGQTSLGRDLAPRLAFRQGTGVAMDCVELSIDLQDRSLLQTRPVYGGNALAVLKTETKPQVATIRPKSMTEAQRDTSRRGEVISIPVNVPPGGVNFVKKVTEEVEGVKLEDAEIISSSPGGGAWGGTRPVCDSGWLPAQLQIGLTGKMVSPNLYLVVAASGSSQHMAGCSGARNIVAINKDPEANVFKYARFGVVADYRQLLPPLTEKCKELLSG
ncbi:MAG: electron transfer flavoprotein subunit alpha/FixB family protein [Chloroflexi bacterium]|nr:electron transfer flavoprotein subunit alpha/FixB family protein [Chloroflexota bacterium]